MANKDDEARQPPASVVKQMPADVDPTMDDRRVKFTVTTRQPDRERDVVEPEGAELGNFLRNPVIQWAHMYRELPIGRAVEILPIADGIQMVIEFATAALNPMAEQVYRLIQAGFLRACSIGFRPLEWAYDEERKGYNFKKWELLEVSICPVPAHPGALVSASAVADLGVMKDWAHRALAWVAQAEVEADQDVVGKGVAPKDVSRERAPEDEAWKAPKLSDFTDTSWEELDAATKRKIAGHFAWCAEMPPAAFGSCKLPHHRASDGKIVWRGVVAAIARLGAADLPSGDDAAVKAHLARHYLAFRPSAELPETLKESAAPWDRDAVGWKAYAKAARRAVRADEGSEVAIETLAQLLGDYGFDEEAAALTAPAVASEPEAAVVNVMLDGQRIARIPVMPGEQDLLLTLTPEQEEAYARERDKRVLTTEQYAALEAEAAIGRVVSPANEAWLRRAADALRAAREPAPDSGVTAEDVALVILEEASEEAADYVVTLDMEEDDAERVAELADAELVGTAVREALRALVGTQVRTTINALRGRID